MDAFTEAQRWLNVAERLLSMRDLQSARTFAIRAREADPRLDFADRILAVADTLIAGDALVNNSFVDYYAVLQLARWTQNAELIATQYRKLASLLNPNVNKLEFADPAFRLVCEAWAVLSNSERKAIHDGQLELHLAPHGHGHSHSHSQVSGSSGLSFQQQWVQQPGPINHSQRQVQWDLGGSSFVQQAEPISGSNWLSSAQREQQQRQQVSQQELHQQQEQQVSEQENGEEAPKAVESSRTEEAVEEEEVSEDMAGFWTACPYCFYLYEYPKRYEECTLRCQHCERAFQAVVVPAPPIKKDGYFCCWGFYPLGCPRDMKKTEGYSGWSPISPMFACPIPGGGNAGNKKVPRFVFSDDDVFEEVSDPSDDSDDGDWNTSKRKERAKSTAGKIVRSAQSERGKKVKNNGSSGENMNGSSVTRTANFSKGESSRNGVVSSVKKQTGRFTRGMGRLDLNVELSNEVEEPAANQRNRTGNGTEDNIEGTNFFEGLDEFLSTLPILNVVGGDDKVKAA